jgi:hypothetical protein
MESRIPLGVVESKCNDEVVTRYNNSVTDVCGIKNKNGNQIDLYVTRETIPISENQILYPLTVRSNYQQVGSWNMTTITPANKSDNSSNSDESKTSKEIELFFRFVDSIMELSKIYKEYPSTMLFLQNVDYRDKNEKITKTELQRMYDELISKTSFSNISEPRVIQIENSCNRVFYNLNFMLYVWYIMISTTPFNILGATTPYEINARLFMNIKNFYDNFIFLLIYAGCINLAQLLCNKYTECVLSNANGNAPGSPDFVLLDQATVKSKFMNAFTKVGFGNETINNRFKTFFSEKSQLYDRTFPNIMICSDPHTYSGVAYVTRRLDQGLVMMINSEVKQKTLQNKIYKSNEDFFDSNNEFFTTAMASDLINTIDQINYFSFYKFRRLQNDGNLFRTSFGAMTDTTIYACVNVNVDSGSNVQMDSGKVLEFLKVIISYFKRLPSGSIVVDIGISGPIQRIIFGGDFGCNLLHDPEVCVQFIKNGMKIYTMPNNSNAFINNANDSGNQMFVVDANLMSSSSSLLVGGDGNTNSHNNDLYIHKNSIKRLKIGELIPNDNTQNMKLVIINHKKKTRRRYN